MRVVDEGAPLTGVRDALGHASLATTNRYVKKESEGLWKLKSERPELPVTNEKRRAS